MIITSILKKIKNSKLFCFLRSSSKKHTVHYRISNIDLENQSVLLHFVHKSIFIKKTFSEIIASPDIIESLSCEQACWIGMYYGKALRNALHGNANLRNIKKPNYLLKNKYGVYKIISENRNGTIECIHIHTRKELNIHPLMIAQDTALINQFDANQACYIGILAGIAIERHETVPEKYKIPFLRVVK